MSGEKEDKLKNEDNSSSFENCLGKISSKIFD
jgi:hypothetical protein